MAANRTDRSCDIASKFRRKIAGGIVLVVSLSLMIVSVDSPAFAQEPPGLTNFLSKLIRGGQPRKAQKPQPQQIRRNTTTRRAKRTRDYVKRSSPEPASPEPQPVEKLETAETVLVIGDFMSAGLADGLQTAFDDMPGVRIVEAANGSSGLVRDDFYDWPESAGPIIEEFEPSVVIVMIGANDRQQMVIGPSREPVRSEPWMREYEKRAARLAEAVSQKNIPLIWVSMVPFKSSRMSADILAFNDVYRSAVQSAGGTFVDIWDGFVDENGAFVMRGPDINGQPQNLRTGDGTVLSKAGRRLAAFYVEKPLRKILGDSSEPDVGDLGPQNLPDLTLDPFASPAEIVRTSPISLNDPELDGGDDLLGTRDESLHLGPQTLSRRLSINGNSPPAPAGRADNFRIRN